MNLGGSERNVKIRRPNKTNETLGSDIRYWPLLTLTASIQSTGQT
jgi:hypothetical protein